MNGKPTEEQKRGDNAMRATERQETILGILGKEGFATVKYLTATLGYSPATVNRDLNALAARGEIRRSYGGAEPVREVYVRIPSRANQMRAEKLAIGRAAAALVKDGDVVFIDGSTTAQCMGRSLTSVRDLTVVTNNMVLAAELSGRGVRVVCLGGEVAEPPSMLCGPETAENAKRYRVDKMFFSTGAVTSEGVIASGIYDAMLRTVAAGAGEVIYLADRRKIDRPFHEVLFDFSGVNVVVSDYDFPAATRAKFPQTRFLTPADVPATGKETVKK